VCVTMGTGVVSSKCLKHGDTGLARLFQRLAGIEKKFCQQEKKKVFGAGVTLGSSPTQPGAGKDT